MCVGGCGMGGGLPTLCINATQFFKTQELQTCGGGSSKSGRKQQLEG